MSKLVAIPALKNDLMKYHTQLTALILHWNHFRFCANKMID